MKRLTLAVCFVLTLAFWGATVDAQRSAARPQTARSPEIVLKEFYTWYIHANCHGIDQLKGKGRVTLKKYVTARFIQEIDRLERMSPEEAMMNEGGDYFLLTQEYPSHPGEEAAWLKNLSVSEVAIRGSTATAIVGSDEFGLKVTLIKEGGVWKIDKVKDARD